MMIENSDTSKIDVKIELTNMLQLVTDLIYSGQVNTRVELSLIKINSLLKEAIEDVNLSQEEIENADRADQLEIGSDNN